MRVPFYRECRLTGAVTQLQVIAVVRIRKLMRPVIAVARQGFWPEPSQNLFLGAGGAYFLLHFNRSVFYGYTCDCRNVQAGNRRGNQRV
jgi:hypothetical protein